MKQQGLKVVAGDIVSLEPEAGGELWGIVEVEARHSVLERRIPGGRGTRAIVANVDRIFVVTASREPAPVPSVIDRLLVLAEANDVTPALIVNKIDLDPGTALVARYLAAGYQVLPVSTKLGQGLEAIRGWLPDHSSVFTGPSGAGKSSLLNALEPGIALRTAAVSEKIGRGMHTTVSAVMIPLSGGGWLVDTPGFSEVGLWGLEARGLAECFPEMRSRLGTCRFQDCRHVSEPGCAIRAAVTEGAIHPDRYASYLLLLEETEEEPRDWE
ncbi:MAG: rsgA [Gemmatimonadetes bacterium]|nr:rsgA [Gemmatimonadota bacterium]